MTAETFLCYCFYFLIKLLSDSVVQTIVNLVRFRAAIFIYRAVGTAENG